MMDGCVDSYKGRMVIVNHGVGGRRVGGEVIEKSDGAQEEKLKAQPNDIIRIFGIATSSFARDDIVKLTEAKAYKRSDLDGAMPLNHPFRSRLGSVHRQCDGSARKPPQSTRSIVSPMQIRRAFASS